jgi:aspartate/methionine/tyrosine aminotransferase
VPQGALYVWVDATGTGATGTQVAASLLGRVGVAVVPGAAFGPDYAGFIRLTYASTAQVVTAACTALAAWTPAD